MLSYFTDQYARTWPNGAGQMFVVMEPPKNSVVMAFLQAGMIVGLVWYGIQTFLKIHESFREEEPKAGSRPKANAHGDAAPGQSNTSQSFSYYQDSSTSPVTLRPSSSPPNPHHFGTNRAFLAANPGSTGLKVGKDSGLKTGVSGSTKVGHKSGQSSSQFGYSEGFLATPRSRRTGLASSTKDSPSTTASRTTCTHSRCSRQAGPAHAVRVTAGANKTVWPAPPTPTPFGGGWLKKTHPRIGHLQHNHHPHRIGPVNSQQRLLFRQYPELETLSACTALPFPSYHPRLPATPLCRTARRPRRSSSVETAFSFDPKEWEEVTGSTQQSTFTFEHRCDCTSSTRFSGTLESFEDIDSEAL